jgi:hypothetical protein
MSEANGSLRELAKADACLQAMADALIPVLRQHEGFHIMLALARIAASNIGGQKDPKAAMRHFFGLVENQVDYAVGYYSRVPPVRGTKEQPEKEQGRDERGD